VLSHTCFVVVLCDVLVENDDDVHALAADDVNVPLIATANTSVSSPPVASNNLVVFI
jgi:hypothetical protein